MKQLKHLSDQDLKQIKEAVAREERRVSGEITPALVRQSHSYPSIKWKSALFFGTITFMFLIIIDRFLPGFAIYDPLYYFSFVAGATIAGAVLPIWIPAFKRALLSEAEMNHAIFQKAETIFLEEEVFNTEHRTGILIFISFLERKVIIMADSGISQKIDQQVWDEIASSLTSEIKRGMVIKGIEMTIAACGKVLLDAGFEVTPDDKNELPDHLRVEL